MRRHIPVLKKEVLEILNPKPNENFIDATIGEGGYTIEILKRNQPNGKVLGIDRDPAQIENCKLKIKEFKDRLVLVNDSYLNLKEIVKRNNFGPVCGILFDLGMSLWHVKESKRGFTFQEDEPLDMRYDTQGNNLTAEKIINEYSQEEIEHILREYGEEWFAKRLAKVIIKERPIKTTFKLLEVIRKARIYSPDRIFQAFRIAVNGELNNIRNTLPQIRDILAPGGKIVIISFHSLEDRIVKFFFKEEAKKNLLKVLTKKPIRPSKEEIKTNPCSRSAMLRAAIKK